MIATRLLLLICSFVAPILAASRPDLTATESQLPFEGRSFSLRSSVTVINLSQSNKSTPVPANTWSQVYESYSTEQQRAKLSFKFVGPQVKGQKGPELGNFYFDFKQGTVLLFNMFIPTCKESSVDEIREKLGITFFQEFEQEEQVADEYIVGPARLLYFIEHHRDKLKLSEMGEPVLVRNIPTLMYTLNFSPDKLRRPVRFGVYYSEAALALDPQSIPLQVIIETDQQVRIIDFSQMKLLATNTALSDSQNLVLRSGTTLDPFTFPILSSCSKPLTRKSVSLFENKSQDMVKFSFEAVLKFTMVMNTGPVNVMMNMFIAYDGPLSSLRVDMATSARTGVRRQVFNFKLNRMYHSVERFIGGNQNLVDRILDLSKESADPDDADALSETTQCMVARILPPMDEKTISIGRLLVGADKFVYMGKAQVRGMPALVYEAYNASMPFWLDQPMEYSYGGQSRLRRPERGVRESNSSSSDSGLSVLLYLAEQEIDHPILRIELNSLKSKKQTVIVNHFAWSLDKQAPDGDRTTEMFSLEDLCSAGMGKNNYAKVEVLLEPDNGLDASRNTQIIKNSMSRDMGLLAGLQRDVKLPATMIYDLESKLVAPANTSAIINSTNSGLQPAIVASFRVAKHVDNLAELVYLGQGRVNVQYEGPRTTLYWRTFQSCFFLAAHRRANIYFGFNPEKRICSVDLEPIMGPSKMINELPPSFTLDPRESMEVYRISHVIDPVLSTSTNTWIEDTSHFKQRFRLLGKRLAIPAGNDSLASFTIKRFRLDDRDYKTSIATNTNTTGPDSISNKVQPFKTNRISGFGFLENDPQNRRVAPASLRTSNWSPLTSYLEETSSTMTFDQCHAACLSDYSCQSFSLCIKNGELQCVLSKISLRTANVARQLAALSSKNKGSLSAKKVQVTLDDGEEITLTQHQNCEIYSKIYMDLFEKPMVIKQTFSNRRVYAVTSEENCAQICVERNIEVLRDDVSRASASYATFAEASLNPQKDQESLVELLELHRISALQLCKVFLYWDKVELDIRGKKYVEAIESRIIDIDQVNSESIDGYCVIGDRLTKIEEEELSAAKKHDPHQLNDYIQSQMFQFKAETFYEKQYGVKLEASKMNANEYQAYRLAKRESPQADESTYTLLRSLIILGDNFQDKIYADQSKCALVCFMQSWGPWPACRSFDVVIETLNNRTIMSCYLNSITMHQAIETQRFDLINDSKQHQLWHFEPRSGFALEEGGFSESLQWIESYHLLNLNSNSGTIIGSLGVIFILILALSTGLFLGLYLGPKLMRDINEKRRNLADKEILVRRGTIIEFRNQVNSEGKILGD